MEDWLLQHRSALSSRDAGNSLGWRSDRFLTGFLVLFSLLPYVNTLWNGFVYDDDIQVLKNPYIRDFSHLKAIFVTTVWSYAGGVQGSTNYYRPVMDLTYLFCHKIFGYQPWGFHLTSLIFHAAVVCLLFIVTRRIFQSTPVAFGSAALFALHPIHTEAVDWIAAVTDLELAFFFLLAFWFFLRLRETEARESGIMQLGMIVSFGLALLSKEPAVTLPFLATFYEHALGPDRFQTRFSLKVRRYATLWLLLIAYLILRIAALGAFTPVPSSRQMPADAVIFSAIALVGHYLEKMIWPFRLCAFYIFPNSFAILVPRIIAGSAALIVCIGIMFYFWNRERAVCFGFIWFFVTLAPVLNARWMPTNVFAERYLYLPSVGLCWVGAWLGWRLWGVAKEVRAWRWALAAGGAALAILLIVRIVTRNSIWKNDLTFYTETLRASPRAAEMHNNLGMYYWDRQNLEAAGKEWEQALEIEPRATYILDNLGLLRVRQKRYEEAVVYFQRSLDIAPQDVDAHTGLGEAYAKMGLREKAETELRTAVALAPLDVRPLVHLGELYFDEAKYDLAEREFLASIRALPTLRGYFGLGLVHWVRGDRAAAEEAFKTALRLDPSDGRPYFMLGLLYGSMGRTADAIREYEAGLKVDPTNHVALAALAKLKGRGTPSKSP
jgi:tetratricopeptide (TPR) repeat protein